MYCDCSGAVIRTDVQRGNGSILSMIAKLVGRDALALLSITMPVIACPIPICSYVTDDVDAIIAVALLNTHAIIHAPNTLHQLRSC